ncbi:sulfotransferase domain protein [Burkholderia thailandensis 34]|uniref:sulfotransferase family protein n=1 Tax=Burkholderia thailandensis TaxID=57975 RepID=UPI0005D748D6|nr:sulfotransferase [Burkholderia thailandensis]AJY30841.1 sulfotransferase domain protein [Burkholderia thailandensis 34]AOJ59029.1 sulfotransferase [Burkholderia thailandensis]KXF58148.1 sulfotransferase [Burkholderia thailandensis]PNE79067.1 sulfotransferase [Burkholderia thailandensis]
MTHAATSGATDAVRPRPVLMIPLRRCGSHALRLRLNLNSQFYSPYPLHVVDFMPLLPLYGDLADDRAYFRLVADVVGLQAASMVKWPGVAFDPVEIFDAVRHAPRSVHRIVWELLLRAGEHEGARVVMDKSLDSVHYADELMALFPDMLFLNVVRDPRAQVASMNRAIIHDFDTLLNARTWVAAHRAADAVIARHPQRVLTIRYEDFLSDQAGTLQRICAFFGIDFLPRMLDVANSHEALRISRMSALWASNCFAPIAANADKFKQQLSITEIATIETLTHEYMQRYGYQRMTDASAPPDAFAAAAARRRSDARRRHAWRELEQSNFRDFVLRRHRADYLEAVRVRLQRHAGTHLDSDGDSHAGAPGGLDTLTAAFDVTD